MSRAAVASLVVFLVAFAIGAGTLHVFTEVEKYAEVFAGGQMLSGHPLGGMTAEEGSALLDELTQETVAAWRYEITCQGRSYVITAEDVGLFIDRQATLEPLWQVGKTGSMVERYLQLMQARAQRSDVTPVFGYTMDAVDALIAQIQEETDCEPANATVRYVPGNSVPFRFTDEQVGYALDTTGLRDAIERAICALTPGSTELVPQTLKPEVTRASLEAATSLRAKLVVELDADEGALRNVQIAAGMLNGLRVDAGETLSFNAAVGKRLAEAGYVSAPEPAYGEGAQGVGGGVCQASTALYRAALLGGLEISARSAAVRPVDYCGMGQEAVVSDQGLDLEIVNTTGAPLFITTRIYVRDDGTNVLELQLIGEELEERYALVSEYEETTWSEEPVYVRDSEGTYATYTDERVPVGEAQPGYAVTVRRVTLGENGEQLASETISEDTYEPAAPTIYVGVNER